MGTTELCAALYVACELALAVLGLALVAMVLGRRRP